MELNAVEVKAKALDLGADLVGIASARVLNAFLRTLVIRKHLNASHPE